jgi:hypothetical protein
MTANRTLLVALAAGLAAAFAHFNLAGRTTGDLLTLVRALDFAEVLDGRMTVAQQFSMGKRQAAAELIAGRITFRQAVERFSQLHALVEDGNGRDGVAPFRLASGEEALWHNVLIWLENYQWHQPGPDSAAALARLRAEYRERFGHDPGPVKPPGR